HKIRQRHNQQRQKQQNNVEKPPCSQRQGMRKQQHEVLSPPLHRVSKAAIHARRERVWRVAKANCPFGPLHIRRKLDVLQHRPPYRLVPTNGKVCVALDHQKLSIRRSQPSFRIIHLRHRIHRRQLRKHQRHQRMLRDTLHNLPWRIREQRRAVLLRLMQRMHHARRLVQRVRIGKQQPASTRLLCGKPAAVRFPREHFCIQPRRTQHHHSRILCCSLLRNRPCAIGRRVIDDQQLPIASDRKRDSIVLRQQRGQAPPQHSLLISRGNDHRKLEDRRLTAVCLRRGNTLLRPRYEVKSKRR